MSDPDRINDTEPTGCPLASAEGADADEDEATKPGDASHDPAGSNEQDTDDFLRWLPTLALGHRRRTELVERPSSDGADFAAYACEGRPAAISGQAGIESAVKVQAARGSKDPERDASTVLTGERRARRRWRRIGWASFGVAAAGAALAGWAWRPVTTQKAPRREEAVATPPVPIASTRTQLAEPAQPAAAPVAPASQGSSSEVARTDPERRAPLGSPPAAEATRKKDSAGAPKTVASSAMGRAAPLAAAPTVPAKDQYFEVP